MSINVNDKNLGHATAYAYYKAGGGTMTEAEFTEFMADFGTASQTAVEAAQAALASKNAAQTAATTATNKATEATTAATTATTKAGEASTSASTATSAKDTAVSASQTATTKATEATTAAATATSAATTATTAKDDAVSAKTAAQTAQTGAETAAASVQSSAEQIATNAEDISQLKSDLTATNAEVTDIRVGANGITYNSAGSAVRGQIGDITEKTTNLFDINVLNAGSVSVTDNEAVGTAVAFTDAFFASIHTGIEYEGNTQYVISGKAKHDGSSASNNGLRIQVTYTDESTENIFFSNSWTSFNDFSLVTSASKTISKLSFNYSNVGYNVWHIKEMQITKGTTREKYIPYKTAVDYVARSEIEEIQNIIFEPDYYPLVWEYGSMDPSTGTDANSSENLRTGDIIHVKSGSKLIKNNNAVSLMAYFYEDYNESNFDSYTQIMPASLEEYTFTENAFVRFVLQNPTSLDHNPTWGNQVLESKIIDADSEYRKIGLEIGILGYSNYLGNAILIRFPNGEIMGIDSFIASAQTPLINDYVRFGALHFDYFMITHYHKDHVGNVQYLIEHGYIDENTIVFLPQDLDTSYTSNIFFDWNDADGPKAMYEAVKPALEASGATLIIPTEGQTVCVAGVTIKFWNCDHSVYYPNGAYHTSNYNDLSLCCYINLGNYNFCHTADLGPIGQQRMVDLNTMKKANLYTATHHGWDNGDASNYYGLLPAWINRLSPDVVFSEDYSAHNTHIMTKTAPMQSWCEASGVPNYRTAINGSMFIRLNECGWKLLGNYSRFIRNDKNWSYSDNSEHIET